MKTKILPFIIITTCLLVGCQKKEPKEEEPKPIGEKITYRVPTSETEDVEDYLYYSDDYFKNDASYVSLSFSDASLGLVEGTSPSIEGGSTDFSRKYVTGESLLTKMGFSGVTHDAGYENKPTAESIGALFGKKEISVNNKNYTLVVTAVRSINYKLEWVSQFNMGESGDHAGFKNASTTLLNELKDYIANQNISGNIKLWMVGHSRGGTVANLVGGQLDIDLLNNVKTFGNKVSYSKNDLYIQCFNPALATVNEGNYDIHGDDFNNIQCFTNTDDLVSYVAPASYGFLRFGKSYYLPSPVTTIEYSSYFNTYSRYYRTNTPYSKVFGEASNAFVSPLTFRGTSLYSGTKVDDTKVNWTAHALVKDFVDELFTKIIRNRAYYVAYYQSQLMTVINYLMTRYTQDELYNKSVLTLISEIQANAFDTTEEANAFTSRLMSDLNLILADNPTLLATFMDSGLSALSNAHRSCFNRTWLKIMDVNYMVSPISYDLSLSMKKVIIYDKNDQSFDFQLTIHDQNNAEIVKFTNGVPMKQNSFYCYGKNKNEAAIYLPADGQYTISITANRDATIRYSVARFDINTTQYKTINQSDYSLTNGNAQTINL